MDILKRIFPWLRTLFNQVWTSHTMRQSATLYVSNILVMASGLITAPIVTRELGPERYGDLAFILSFISFVFLFFDFGLYDSGAKLLANVEDPGDQKRILGAYLLLILAVVAVFTAFFYSSSFWIDSLFDTNVNSIVRNISLFASSFLIQTIIAQLCRGLNKINLLFYLRVLPIIWYLFFVVLFAILDMVSVQRILFARLLGIWVAIIPIIFLLRPDFQELRKSILAVLTDIKEYGFQVFVGRASSTAARQSDRLFIGFFGTTTSVGFYSLAQMLVQPITFFPQALVSSSYRQFVLVERIPRRVFFVIIIWLIITSLGLLLFGEFIVELLLSKSFDGVVPLMVIAIIGAVLAGLTQPFSVFLGAKGMGEFMRNMALTFAVYDVIANLILIYLFGPMGAVYSFVGERALSFGLHLHYYRLSLQRIKSKGT